MSLTSVCASAETLRPPSGSKALASTCTWYVAASKRERRRSNSALPSALVCTLPRSSTCFSVARCGSKKA
ncbi:hypothetical protein D3C72_963760 [compost metagenome]